MDERGENRGARKWHPIVDEGPWSRQKKRGSRERKLEAHFPALAMIGLEAR